MDVALAAARTELSAPALVSLPWECQGTFLNMVLGNQDEPRLIKRPRLEPLLGNAEPSISRDPIAKSEVADYRFRIAKVRSRSNAVDMTFSTTDQERDTAHQKWMLILRINPLASEAGCYLDRTRSGSTMSDEAKSEHCRKLSQDMVATKATGTLADRADSLMHYLKWAATKYPSTCPLPINEEFVYTFMDEVLRQNAATTADKLLQSLRFSHGVFGVQGALEAAGSKRCSGLAKSMLLHKRPKQQAAELTDIMVVALECFLHDEDRDNYLRLMSGLCLLNLSLRVKSSDSMRLHCLQVDTHISVGGMEVGYVEALARGVNNVHKPEQKVSFLPMCGPAFGLAADRFQQCWARKFLELRVEAGLDALPVVSDVADGSSLTPIVVLPRLG